MDPLSLLKLENNSFQQPSNFYGDILKHCIFGSTVWGACLHLQGCTSKTQLQVQIFKVYMLGEFWLRTFKYV